MINGLTLQPLLRREGGIVLAVASVGLFRRQELDHSLHSWLFIHDLF